MLHSEDSQPFPVEDEVTEYKESFNEKCKKEIAAFLNGNNTAYIYLGVADKSRRVTHTYTEMELHNIEEQLGRWLSSSIYYPSPVGLVQIYYNHGLLCLEIRPGKFKPYFLDDKAYVRNGSESIKASPERVTKMIASQSLGTFDVSESPIQNVSFDSVRLRFKKQNLLFKPKSLGFYDSRAKFTNAALLMSDQNPFLVKIAVFDGLTVEQFKNRRQLSGSLLSQIDDALTFIDLNNPLAAQITGSPQRTEQRSYPNVAVREAVVNAIVHRSYFSQSPVQIEVFDDRLTILSPGPLPGGMQLEAVLDGQTLPRNPQIVKTLNKLKYVEDYGTGIRRILSSYASTGRKPIFVAKEDYVKVTLPNLNYQESLSGPEDINGLETAGVAIFFESREKIVAYLKSHVSITRSTTEVLLNISGTQANRYLKRLVAENVLEKIGAGPATKYVLGS
ncbi:ATP-binding protein [Lactiplantibacillus nangangensis]|uniref:ATP-binding protein n=1 Tax=Lactiplantibacillus nangangensis TaxID=2559917 RepID=A0ABW1SFT3_9LACO|nr:ATP-binding protein [Lactiplantibacillus nangangensis]